jgi:hypothetical protein
MARPMFTDGICSAGHVGLGLVGGREIFPWFVFYQFVLAYDHNSVIDTMEYVTGWLLSPCVRKELKSSSR